MRFIQQFPDVDALARASQDEVMTAWQGLGYYSRARNLHAAAKSIAAKGCFPADYNSVRALKGVGDYTAAAICSMAYGLPHAAVDGNVYRVLARYFGLYTPIDTTIGKKQFAELAQELLDRKNPGLYNQAMMDFGALQCTPKAPDCPVCPLRETCHAATENATSLLPVKSKRTKTTKRFFIYVYVTDGENAYLHRRKAGDIWEGLYETPLFEYDHQPEDKEVLDTTGAAFGKNLVALKQLRRGVKHILSHRQLIADFYIAHVKPPFSYNDFMPVPLATVGDYPFSRLVSHLIAAAHDDMEALLPPHHS